MRDLDSNIIGEVQGLDEVRSYKPFKKVLTLSLEQVLTLPLEQVLTLALTLSLEQLHP